MPPNPPPQPAPPNIQPVPEGAQATTTTPPNIVQWALSKFFHRHIWISDLPLSLDGAWAVLAGLWMPPSTCRCGKKRPGFNRGHPDYVDEQTGTRWRIAQ